MGLQGHTIREQRRASPAAMAIHASSLLWHERCAHVNEMRVVQMLKRKDG